MAFLVPAHDKGLVKKRVNKRKEKLKESLDPYRFPAWQRIFPSLPFSGYQVEICLFLFFLFFSAAIHRTATMFALTQKKASSCKITA